MAKEIRIGAAFISNELTARADEFMLAEFSGFFRACGVGGYRTRETGKAILESAIVWDIATGWAESTIAVIISEFAKIYCADGKQESIYFRDKNGQCFIVTASGVFTSMTGTPIACPYE